MATQRHLFKTCIGLFLPVMVVLLLWVRVDSNRRAPPSSTGPAAVAPPELPPRHAAAHSAQPRRFTGVVVAREAANLSPQFDGRLESVEVQVGDTVRRGDIVARLDTEPLRREVAIAQAEVQAARVELDSARLSLEEVRDQLKRRSDPRQLHIGAISEEELATVQYKERQTASRVTGAQVKVQEREAQMARLQQQLQSATLRAPFDGTVAMRYADPGIQVAQGQPILQLLRSEEQLIRFAVPEDDAPHVTPGIPVEVWVPDRSLSLQGRVEKVAPEVDAASRMVLAMASIEGAVPERVLSGSVVDVMVTSDTRGELHSPQRSAP